MEKTLSPLEVLQQANQKALKRQRPAKPIKFSDEFERRYRGQLRLIVQAMAKAVDAEITPILRAEYTADSPMLDRLIAALQRVAARFIGVTFVSQAERLAQSTLSMAEAGSTAAFVSSVNRAVGIDMGALMSRDGIQDYMDVAIADNVSLIKSLGTEYFEGIEQAIYGGMRSGESVTTIAKRIQHETGSTYTRARLIARDQMAKINTDVARMRQQQAGIKRFRWATSQDQRVSGNPAGRYPKAKMKCYMIARQDIGYGPGVYLINEGASYAGETGLFPGRAHVNCRCTLSPLIEGVDY